MKTRDKMNLYSSLGIIGIFLIFFSQLLLFSGMFEISLNKNVYSLLSYIAFIIGAFLILFLIPSGYYDRLLEEEDKCKRGDE